MFAVVGRVYAGDNDVSEDKNDGTRALDSTGAVIPAGYDAVVPVEDAAAAACASTRPPGAGPVPRAGYVDPSRGL